MESKTLLSRLGSGISLPVALVLAILFFLPWVEVQCSRMTFAKASGLQLTVGRITPVQPEGLGPKTAKPAKTETKSEDHPDARPWFIVGLLAPLAALIVGLAGLSGRLAPAKAGTWLIVLGLAGVAITLCGSAVDYSGEMARDMNKSPGGPAAGGPNPDEMAKEMQKVVLAQLKTVGTGALWASLGLYVALLACGAMNHLLPRVGRPVPATYAPPPGPSSPPPPIA